jgi:choline kinase
MSDHVFSQGMVSAMARTVPAPGGVVLAVDPALHAVFDMDDATKVRTDGRRIAQIGKDLEDFDTVDTGLFTCTSGLFEALAEERAHRGDCSLSDGIRRLGKDDRAHVYRIAGGEFWQDVDTPATADHAERLLAPRGDRTPVHAAL